MLNLVMTHSPRLAAMATNKRLGEDAAKDPMLQHRRSWMLLPRGRKASAVPTATEAALREQHA